MSFIDVSLPTRASTVPKCFSAPAKSFLVSATVPSTWLVNGLSGTTMEARVA
jgi:hypothetical protein